MRCNYEDLLQSLNPLSSLGKEWMNSFILWLTLACCSPENILFVPRGLLSGAVCTDAILFLKTSMFPVLVISFPIIKFARILIDFFHYGTCVCVFFFKVKVN